MSDNNKSNNQHDMSPDEQAQAEAAYEAHLEQQTELQVQRQKKKEALIDELIEQEREQQVVLEKLNYEEYRESVYQDYMFEKHPELQWEEENKQPELNEEVSSLQMDSEKQTHDERDIKAGALGKLDKGRIKSISIENFKGIGEKVTIPLKPITLLFGANSAGKSTILQALLYAHEVLNNRNPDADITEFGGEKINLGGFRNLVHGHDLSREIKIGFEFFLSDDGLPLYGLERNYSGELQDEQFYDTGVFLDLKVAAIEITVTAGESAKPYVSKYVATINGECIATLEASRNVFPHLTWLDLDPILNEESHLPEIDLLTMLFVGNSTENKEDSEPPTQEPIDDFQEYLKDAISPSIISSSGDALPVWGEVITFDAVLGREPAGPGAHTVNALLSSVTAGPGELIAKELEQMRYIGPIREIPPRNYTPQKTNIASRWADGMAGWDVLLNDLVEGEKWFFLPVWNALNLGYTFSVERSLSVGPELEIVGKLGPSLFEVDDPQAMHQLFKEAYQKGTDVVRMQDQKNSANVEPCDVGIGVSQVIPVIAGAMSPGCRYLSVEQPELHLHPAIQCNLGDLFISQSKRYPERTFLLETHSEHLILRLLRRIRETSEGELESPSLSLTPDQVGVLYVEETENGVWIKELSITTDGDFAEKWPQGFFDERAEELF